MPRATITGWGTCVPPAVLSNADLELLTDTSDEWITTRTGIKERRIAHVENSQMVVVAGKQAMAAAGVTPDEIDFLIVATCTPDRIVPSAAALAQPDLGVMNAAVMDVNAACSGFVYGLSVANGLFAAGAAHKILLVGSEKLSAFIDIEDRSTAVLFGDGAGAVMLEATDGPDGVLSTDLGCDGRLAGALTVSGFGTEDDPPPEIDHRLFMDGREVFRNAVTQMGEAAARVVADAGLALDDVDLLIPHQANIRIVDATARRLGLSEDKVYVNIASYGNTSAASIPIALDEALRRGRIKTGDHVVLVAFGGGLTWAAAALRWGSRTTPVGTSDAALPPTDMTGIEILRMRDVIRRSRRKS